MGWVVQVNPTSEVHHIQHKLYELLRPHMTDFELIYTAVEPVTNSKPYSRHTSRRPTKSARL